MFLPRSILFHTVAWSRSGMRGATAPNFCQDGARDLFEIDEGIISVVVNLQTNKRRGQ